MSYKAFLLVMSQLAVRKTARVVFEDNTIFFEATEENDRLKFQTKVYGGEGYIPPSVRACVSSGGTLRWQESGAYLQLEESSFSIHLIQEAEMQMGKFVPFRNTLSDFSRVADEWREILQELDEKDCSYV